MKCDTCLYFDGSVCTCYDDPDTWPDDVEECPYYESEEDDL